jgi:hypothetical protein
VSPPAATKSAAHGGAKFSYFPLAYSGSARAWLGETVQLALFSTISYCLGGRCDGRHILAHSDPSRSHQQQKPGLSAAKSALAADQ